MHSRTCRLYNVNNFNVPAKNTTTSETESKLPKLSWMKPKWLPSSLTSLLPSYKSKLHQPASSTSKALTPVHNHVDASLLLSLCGREANLHLGSSLHASIIKTHDFSHQLQDHYTARNSLVICNSLLSMYSKCGVLNDAVKVFDEMPLRDTISWNTLISGFLSAGEFESGLGWFKRMRKSGLHSFDQATLTTILSAFEDPELGFVNRMVHGLVFLSGFDEDVSVGNALVTSYFKCGCSSSGKQVFDEMLERNVISWTAAISGLSQNEFYEDSLRLMVEMLRGSSVKPNFLTYLSALMACSGLKAAREGAQIHAHLWKLGIQSELCIESALMDMYSKCGSVEHSCRIFDSANQLDEVSMTVILAGLAQNGHDHQALLFFAKMVSSGVDLDANMVSSALAAFDAANNASSTTLGQQIHATTIKRKLDSNPFVCNGLINMYSKCGAHLHESTKIFTHMASKNSVSWNSMIAASTRHGDFPQALHLYHDMKGSNVEPTDVTFLSLLHACSHGGFLEEGMQLLKSMTHSNITPRAEHYACIVDMLGRAGLIDEAKRFVDKLPAQPDEERNLLVWQALLGACGIHGDAEMGKLAAEKLFMCAPNEPGPYVQLANIYSAKGRWKERARTIRRMKEMGVGKETGMSWIEVGKEVHSFVVEDRMHPEGEGIYGVVGELLGNMVDEGYVPDKRFLLHCVEDDGGEEEDKF